MLEQRLRSTLLPHTMDGSSTKTSEPTQVAREQNSETEKMQVDAGKPALSRKQRLSPYFTIAAAGFGLVSDGCKYSAQ